MPQSHIKKRNWLILIGFSMLLALGVINLKNLPLSKNKDPAILNSNPVKKEDIADDFIRKASQHFFYREFPEAAEDYYQAIAIYETRRDIFHVAATYEELADLYIMSRDVGEAEKNYIKAADFYSQAKNIQGQTNVLKSIGDIYFKQENFEVAGKWYQNALKVNEGQKPHLSLGQTHEAIGHLYWKTGDVPKALNSFTQAQNTFASIKYNLGFEHLHHVIQKLTKISNNQADPKTSY